MRIILFICCVFISTILYIPTASASLESVKNNISVRELDTWKNARPRFNMQYDNVLKGMYKDPKKIEHEVGLLRSYYTRTDRYSPFSKNILNKLTSYAQIVEESDDSGIINETLLNYRGLLDLHLANFDILSFAVTMSLIDVRFGDAAFYMKLKKSMIKEFYKGSDFMGKRADVAYNVVSYGEEAYILGKIGGRIDKSEIFEVKRKFYNVHDITGVNGEYIQIFVDISTPIRSVLYKQILREKEGKIPMQSR